MSGKQPPATLLEAQAKLLALRESWGIVPHDPPPFNPDPVPEHPQETALDWAQALLVQRRQAEARTQGERASDTLKASLKPVETPNPKKFVSRPRLVSPAPAPPISETDKVKVYPSLAVAMVEQDLAAPGRVYWLLRHMDSIGQGWVDDAKARDYLTGHGAALKVCTWRRLRQILNQGEGVFWRRDGKGRIWLTGAAKLALFLSVERLTGQPVEIPVKQLLGGIRAVRAQFYASFHSGRRTDNPISRETLRDITGVPERTQLEYEKTAAVAKQRNFAVGEQYTQVEAQERAWQHGRATFHFFDTNGNHGQAGREYVAWHLPNSYSGPHAKRNKGRQKKINQRLVGLVMKGMRGNDQERVEKVFWPHGAAAGAAYNRNAATDAYWPQGPTRAHKHHMWHVLPGKK